jgi:hypothetical protein
MIHSSRGIRSWTPRKQRSSPQAAAIGRCRKAWRAHRLEAGRRQGRPGSQAKAANDLEAQGKRLAANVYVSPRLREVAALAGAIVDFNAAAPPNLSSGRTTGQSALTKTTATTCCASRLHECSGFDARPVLVIGSDGPPT